MTPQPLPRKILLFSSITTPKVPVPSAVPACWPSVEKKFLWFSFKLEVVDWCATRGGVAFPHRHLRGQSCDLDSGDLTQQSTSRVITSVWMARQSTATTWRNNILTTETEVATGGRTISAWFAATTKAAKMPDYPIRGYVGGDLDIVT